MIHDHYCREEDCDLVVVRNCPLADCAAHPDLSLCNAHDTEDERRAIQAMRDELEEETRDFDTWLAQPVEDPNANRWRHHG